MVIGELDTAALVINCFPIPILMLAIIIFRFATVRNTLQGKLEERLPFFSFVFPEWFKTKYSQQYRNFQDNLNTLSTPFDVHATLEDILSRFRFEFLIYQIFKCFLSRTAINDVR